MKRTAEKRGKDKRTEHKGTDEKRGENR